MHAFFAFSYKTLIQLFIPIDEDVEVIFHGKICVGLFLQIIYRKKTASRLLVELNQSVVEFIAHLHLQTQLLLIKFISEIADRCF